MQETTFEKERSLAKKGHVIIVGIDEAGRGPLAGPVVAAAVCFKDQRFVIPTCWEKEFALIRDSKKLSHKQRESVFKLIQEYFHVGTGIVNVETIDRINILQATFLAMKSAVAALRQLLTVNSHRKSENNFYLLIDGSQVIPNCSYQQEAIVNGDGIVKSIAAASIIAKVTRDRILDQFEIDYPDYGFAKHKGYGTRMHMEALRKKGPCAIHRMSFRPVILALPENVNKRFGSVLKRRG